MGLDVNRSRWGAQTHTQSPNVRFYFILLICGKVQMSDRSATRELHNSTSLQIGRLIELRQLEATWVTLGPLHHVLLYKTLTNLSRSLSLYQSLSAPHTQRKMVCSSFSHFLSTIFGLFSLIFDACLAFWFWFFWEFDLLVLCSRLCRTNRPSITRASSLWLSAMVEPVSFLWCTGFFLQDLYGYWENLG
jgi:hypothetical protein